MSNTKRIFYLLERYTSKTSSEAELHELLKYFSEFDEKSDLNAVLEKIWSDHRPTEELIDLDWKEIERLSKKSKPQKLEWTRTLKWSVAASFAILLGFTFYFLLSKSFEKSNEIVYTTGFGETKVLKLEDGTQVNLNANSKLIWNKNWKKAESRKVRLEGEAFFNVECINIHVDNHDSESQLMPFILETTDLTVHVLGTSFNAFKRRGKTEIYLEEGAIALVLNKSNVPFGKESEKILPHINANDQNVSDTSIIMQPGDFLSFSKQQNILLQQRALNTEQISAWKEDVLSFRDVEFGELLKNLEDLYGVSFVVENEELLKTRVEFTMPFEDWKAVTAMMELMLKVNIKNITDEVVEIKKETENN